MLFNLIGYHAVIDYFQDKQSAQLEAQFDNKQYNDQDLVFIKLPVNLPYYNNSPEFERVNGSVDIYGVEYKYVKRRIINDTIELACLPNYAKDKFQSAKNDFLKMNSDWQNTHQGKKATGSFKASPLEFCNKLITFSLTPVLEASLKPHAPASFGLPSIFKTVQEQPPDLI